MAARSRSRCVPTFTIAGDGTKFRGVASGTSVALPPSMTRNRYMAAIVLGTTFDGRPEARVIVGIDGTLGCTYKTYRGRGCEARAGRYVLDQGFELIDHAVLVALQSEVFYAACAR